jgi:hypothetical protein
MIRRRNATPIRDAVRRVLQPESVERKPMTGIGLVAVFLMIFVTVSRDEQE